MIWKNNISLWNLSLEYIWLWIWEKNIFRHLNLTFLIENLNGNKFGFYIKHKLIGFVIDFHHFYFDMKLNKEEIKFFILKKRGKEVFEEKIVIYSKYLCLLK